MRPEHGHKPWNSSDIRGAKRIARTIDLHKGSVIYVQDQ
jgi:hypothetical protein